MIKISFIKIVRNKILLYIQLDIEYFIVLKGEDREKRISENKLGDLFKTIILLNNFPR